MASHRDRFGFVVFVSADKREGTRGLIKKFLAVVLVGAVTLVGVELLTRFWIQSSLKGQPSISPIFESLPDSPRTYRLKPKARVLEYHINSRGFRGPEFTPLKPAGTYRIISLGDSIAFGMGVKSYQATMPALLQERLNQSDGSRYEVINAGVPGYNTLQEQVFLEVELLDYAPDLVILNFCLNDADPIELENETQTLLTLPSKIGRQDLSLRTVMNSSYFLRLVKSKFLDLFPALRTASINLRTGEAAWQEMKSCLLRMKRLLDSRRVGLLVVLYPWEVQLRVKHSELETHKDLAAFFNRQGIDHIDLFKPFQDGGKEGLFFRDGVHPTEKGHRLAAAALYDKIWPMVQPPID